VIQFVSGEYPPDIGGVGDYTASLRAALAERGCQSEVVTRRTVGGWDARALGWFVRHSPKAGIVHIQYQAGAYDLRGDICLLPLLVRSRARVVTTFHDVRVPYLFPRAGRLRPAAVRLLARTSHAVIAADERDLRVLGGPSPRHFRVPIGPNVPCAPPDGYERQAFRRSLGLEADDLAIVYFGLLNASKGIELLLAATERILARRPRARLLLLGGDVGASDPTDRLTASSARASIERLGSSVVRTGWLPAPRLSAYLLAGDVALLPYVDGASARRGSLLACAAHRLPIVSTQPAGVEVAPAVVAVQPDAAILADSVLQVAGDRARWQAASHALATEMSWRRIAAAHLEIYDRLVRQAPT
jgi:glycosyltransferase involved in cell wall biosynthesis